MPASNCGLVVGSLALGVAQVGAVRQRASTANDAVHVVETIGNLLQQQSLGTDEMLTRISQYADEAVTPGAAGEYVSSLKAVVDNIESQIEAKIVHAQNATRGKLDTLFKALSDAKAAVEAAKKSAEAADKTWFECAADEQAKRQAAEAGEKSLISSRSNENEACQLQQDNKGFAFDAAGKYTMKFECDFSQGDCDAKLQAFNDRTIKKIEQGAAAALAKDIANYNSLKTTCDTKKRERVEAQSALGSAEGAWSTKRALCKKLAAQRESSFCAFGSSAQDKCMAERQYSDLVEATQKSKGGDDSEVDRTAEWVASQTTKCLVSLSLAKGLYASITSADADACASKVNFKSGVGGKLNTRQSEFDTLAGSFKCAVGAISFFNGQMWNVPAGDKPKSSAYTRTAFTPALNPSAGNFDFCATKTPAVPKCDDQKFGLGFCSTWCNTAGKWGCGSPTLHGTDGRNTDNKDYTCDCRGCNGCPEVTASTLAPTPAPAAAPAAAVADAAAAAAARRAAVASKLTATEQYTPDAADWSTFKGNAAHDPDSVSWVNWEQTKWDGTIYNPKTMSKKAFWKAICPHVDAIRGIREVFYQVNPFKDNVNPTKAEVDEWHRIAITHLRKLIGWNSSEHEVKKDHCMFARAQWGEERMSSTMWDIKYPAKRAAVWGPCGGSKNAHCGATFLPDAADQASYLPSGHAACKAVAGSEGVFSGPKSNIPWSVKWSRAICNTLIAEGFCGGHSGPWFGREKVGLAFRDADPGNHKSPAVLRAKWTGRRADMSMFCG